MSLLPTILAAKSLLSASRLLGRGGGSALPGLFAEKIDPGIGAKLASRIPHGSIIVTGTNGKTTTSKMIAAILNDAGEKVVSNRAGSNLSRGVVSALIEHASPSGRFDETIGLFEVDEAAMPTVARMIQPRAIIVLNLFRDQLDRYGELNTTAKLVGKGIAATGAKVYLNADDPLVASLAKYAQGPVEYFGIDKIPSKKLDHDVTADSDSCPVCGRALDYSRVFYGHIGHYACPDGHIKRPLTTVEGTKIKLGDKGSEFSIKTSDQGEPQVAISLPGVYNIYNALAAATAGLHLGTPLEDAALSLERVQAAFGRVEKVVVGTKTLYLLLVKNPTGFNQVIQTFLLQKKQQNLLFIINDNFADGRDVSWLWDVGLEELTDHAHTVDTAGIRATDMALRLKYAGITCRNVENDISSALNKFIDQLPENGTGYIIPTYTAMLEVRGKLAKKATLAGVWE